MYCSCSQRSNQWMPNEYNNTLPTVRKSRENLTYKKSSLKNPSRPGSITSSKKSVDICTEPRFSTLPRSSSRNNIESTKSPNVSTIFKNDSFANLHQHHRSSSTYNLHNRQRRRSEVIPWHHQKPAEALQCTCRNSCYFCQLNYPKVNYPLSSSSNALNTYHLPISTLSLNNPNYIHRSQFNLSTNSIHNNQQQQYKTTASNLHHHSMINLNNITHNSETNNQSPEMSDTSPIPLPPIPPLNPSCARCRFTAVTGSNGTINCSQNCNSQHNAHAGLSQQNSLSGFVATATTNNVVGNCYPGEFEF